jgi:hypothetical protein
VNRYGRYTWFAATLTRYRQTVIKGKESNYPPEYLKAVEEYTNTKFLFRSELWEGLQKWREHVERNPEPPPWYRLINWSTEDRENAEWFQNLLLYAAFFGEKEIIQTLLETVTLTQPPDPDMHAVRAAITAFGNLFKGGGEDDWPLKKEVREAATEILTKASSPIPQTSPEWARVFRKAGLSKLRTARRQSKID